MYSIFVGASVHALLHSLHLGVQGFTLRGYSYVLGIHLFKLNNSPNKTAKKIILLRCFYEDVCTIVENIEMYEGNFSNDVIKCIFLQLCVYNCTTNVRIWFNLVVATIIQKLFICAGGVVKAADLTEMFYPFT